MGDELSAVAAALTLGIAVSVLVLVSLVLSPTVINRVSAAPPTSTRSNTLLSPMLISDVNPGSASSIMSHLSRASMVSSNGQLFFPAQDGVHGIELWKSTGSAASTVMITDAHPGSASWWPEQLIDHHGTAFYAFGDSTHGKEVWKSDGTPTGTVMIKYIGEIGGLTAISNTLFFAARDSSVSIGKELYTSNGTNVTLVKDIYLGYDNSANPTHLTTVSNTLFFAANDGTHGTELWKSDGTVTGTVTETIMVKDIYPGSSSTYKPIHLTEAQGRLFFVANDGSYGNEVWVSDGTPTGTLMLKDVQPAGVSLAPGFLTAAGDWLYFVANDSVHGQELWGVYLGELSNHVYLPLIKK